MKQLGLLVVFLLITNVGFAQHSGSVFIDSNKNGVKDNNEKPVEGAVLSDGYHVVKSDKQGNFKLPGWKKERFVTIYTGADFSCKQRYIPINETRDEYSFALTPKAKNGNTKFVHISDTETFEYRDWVDELKQYIKVHKPDFVMHTGDICYESGMDWHSKHLTEKQLGIPIYYCLGNHDLIKGDYGEQFFEKCFGPAWYAFEQGNALYVVTPMMGGDYKPGFNRSEIGQWMKNLLAVYDTNQPKLFFNHSLLSHNEKFHFKTSNEDFIALEEFNLKAWVYGHWHINREKEHGDSGIKSYCVTAMAKGGIDHSPSAFRIINVDENGDTRSNLRWTYLNREIAIVKPINEIAIANNKGEIDISVNTYHTSSEIDSVKFFASPESGFKWTTSMEYSRWKHMKQQSDWNWVASFSAKNQSKFDLVVYAYLRSGEILNTKKKFTINQAKKTSPVNAQWHNLAGNKEHHPHTNNEHNMPYRLEWSANIGSNIYMSSPVLYNNSVITASFDDGNNENCNILCFNAATGHENWRYKTRYGVKNQMVIAKGLVIATDMNGFTYAINIDSGKLEWEKDLDYKNLSAFNTGIVTDGEVVYTGFAQNLSALKVNTGEEIWRNDAWKGGMGATPTMTIADDVLIASKHWGALYAHDRNTGKLLWSRSDDGLRMRNGVVSYRDGYLWVTSDFKGESKLQRLSLKTGETNFSFINNMNNGGTSAPIVLDDKVIIASAHPGIAAFEKLSGKRIWQFEVGEAMLYTPQYMCDRQQIIETTPVLVGNKVVFGAADGNLYVLDENTGKLLWKTVLGAPILTTVAVSDKHIYVCDFAGNIYCFQSN